MITTSNDGKDMENVKTAMHFGIHRASTLSKTGELNVDENLKKTTKKKQEEL